MKTLIQSALLLGFAFSSQVSADELTGNVGLEGRYFLQDSQFNQQLDQQLSLHVETEFYFATFHYRKCIKKSR